METRRYLAESAMYADHIAAALSAISQVGKLSPESYWLPKAETTKSEAMFATTKAPNQYVNTSRACGGGDATSSIELPSEAAGVIHMHALTPVFEMPARGGREPIGVLVAQIVGMRVAFEAEIIEPNRGTGVLVRESD
jgi:hypothetical protein